MCCELKLENIRFNVQISNIIFRNDAVYDGYCMDETSLLE
jgi:hypothetical protein